MSVEPATRVPCTGRTRRSRPAAARALRAADGRRFVVRRMHREDRALYEAAVAALSQRSRYLRFAAPVPKLSGPMLDRLMDLDEHRHIAYGALTVDGETLLGVARYVRLADAPDTAEIAVEVLDEWQGAGLGALLLGRLCAHARRAGIRSLVAVTLAENTAARALARSAGFAARGASGNSAGYRLELAPRPPRGGAPRGAAQTGPCGGHLAPSRRRTAARTASQPAGSRATRHEETR